MEEIINIIVSQISIWLPSVTAILGTVIVLIKSLASAKAAIDQVKNTAVFNQLNTKLQKQVSQNAQIRQQLDIVIDQLKQIKDYRKELQKK